MTDRGPRLPDFFVIGAGKAGTTSLHHYLDAHPQIRMSAVKEPNHFAFEGQPMRRTGRHAWRYASPEAYAALFAGADPDATLGEASPVYLRSATAARRIAGTVPDARIVAILRDPVARAVSHYRMSVRDGLERRPLGVAVRAEATRAEPLRPDPLDLRYLADGEYHRQLVPWFERFDAERVRVLLYDDLVADPRALLRGLFDFLGVDPEVDPARSERHNRGGAPRSALVQYALRPRGWTAELRGRLPSGVGRGWDRLADGLKRRNSGGEPPPPDPDALSWLAQWYRADVARLSDLIGRDLSGWASAERS